MPGVVKQWSEAYGKVEYAAASDGQHWDVRSALDENFQITKQSSADLFPTFQKQLDHAVKMTLGEIESNTAMREESEAIDRSDPQIREWNIRILDEAFWQGSSDAQGNKPHAYENRTAPIDPEIKAAYEEGREQWQRDQLSQLTTPELHDRWVSAVREYWDKCESLDYWNGYFSADDHAAELEAQTKLIYTEMNKPERVAELHELEQAPPWIEQGLSY